MKITCGLTEAFFKHVKFSFNKLEIFHFTAISLFKQRMIIQKELFSAPIESPQLLPIPFVMPLNKANLPFFAMIDAIFSAVVIFQSSL